MELAAVLDDLEDAGLEILHNGVGPEAGVVVEVGGEALVAGEVEEDVSVRQRFETILPVEDIEVATADGDVLVEGGGWDICAVRTDGEGETVVWFPGVDGFDEGETALKGGVTDAADAFVRKRGFDGPGEADAVCPRGAKFGG